MNEDTFRDFSREHDEVRREMRSLLLHLDASNADEVKLCYYRTLMLAEHEAARRATLAERERCATAAGEYLHTDLGDGEIWIVDRIVSDIRGDGK